MFPAVLMLFTLAAPACAVTGSTGLRSDLQTGIGGLVGPGPMAEGLDPREAKGWRRFHATDAATRRLDRAPALRYGAGEVAQLRRHIRQERVLEASLAHVIETGAGRPGIAALARLGDVYLSTDGWLKRQAVPPRYTTPAYAKWATFLEGLGLHPTPPWRPPDDDALWTLTLCDCGAASIHEERAVAAWAMAVRKARELGLAGSPAALHALAGLERLRPDDYPPRWEALPAPYHGVGWENTP